MVRGGVAVDLGARGHRLPFLATARRAGRRNSARAAAIRASTVRCA